MGGLGEGQFHRCYREAEKQAAKQPRVVENRPGGEAGHSRHQGQGDRFTAQGPMARLKECGSDHGTMDREPGKT